MREAMNGGPSQMRRTNNVAVFGLLRSHLHDWIILFGLLVLDRVLAGIHPFNRFVGEYMLDDIRYPHKANTVPFWAVLVVAVFIPFLLSIFIYLKKRDFKDLHHAVLGLLFSVLLSAVITDAVKDGVGRPRPDFFWRCFPDGHTIFKNISGEVVCHGDPKAIREGHRSFPSGHTSWCFGGLGFLSLYLAGKIKLFNRRGHVAELIIVFFPLVVATFVGISRVNDYKHHWQDVFAGALLGLTMSTLCYRRFFLVPNDNHCMHSSVFEITNNANALAQNQHAHSPLPVNSTVSDIEMVRNIESQQTGD